MNHPDPDQPTLADLAVEMNSADEYADTYPADEYDGGDYDPETFYDLYDCWPDENYSSAA